MAANFDAYLDVPIENVEGVKALPDGHFYATMQGWSTREVDYKQGAGLIPVLSLTFRTTAPCDDVDLDLLGANGGIGVVCSVDWEFAAVSDDGKVEGGAQDRARRLAEALDLDVKGLALRDVLEALKGQDVKLLSAPRNDKDDPSIQYTRIKRVLAPDAE